MTAIIRLLRPHQWTKNILVIAPLFFHGDANSEKLLIAFYAFLSFCAAASCAYCLNDAIDADKDRLHPTKRLRPIASGAVSRAFAFALSALLGATAFIGSIWLGQAAAMALATYLLVQVLYTMLLKHIAVLDVIALASMYVLRIVFGCAALSIAPSSWILVCCGLLALMLAFGKRHAELAHVSDTQARRNVMQEYSEEFLSSAICCCGAIALLSYLLWCQEGINAGRFSQLQILPSSLIVSFGIFRYQLSALSLNVREDITSDIFRQRELLISVVAFGIYMALCLYAAP